MKDYERYMNRQRMSETGMARLMKLETERPEKGTRAGKKRQALPRWARTMGMAASLVLVVGLCALPVLRWAAQRANPQPAEEELFFYEEDTTDSFVEGSYYGEEKKVLEPGEAAEIFGCAPDDFVGFLETMGLEKFDMRYRVMDTGSDYFRFLMEGFYTSPREKPENWDEFSEISWEMWQGLSAVMPFNNVVLDIREIRPEAAEDWSWCRYEPRTYHGCQVVAVCETRGYSASAVFHVESGGKTYQVIYGVDLYAQGNAKELVTNMVSYLTTNGLFIEDRGTPQVKTTGLYVMERGESDYPVMPRISFDGESYTFGQSLLSSHLCRGGYEVANGRVTARCNEHHFVFDILDENTLRFVAAESSKPINYKGEPHVTDGAVFRWQEREPSAEEPTLEYAELTQPYVDEDLHAALNWKTQRPMTREELEAVFPACAGEAGENYIWYGTVYFEDDGNLQAVVITGDKMDETETVTIVTSMEEELTFTRNLVKENGENTYFGADNTDRVSGMDLVRCFYVNEPGHFNNAPGACYCYAQYQLTGSPLYTEVRTSVSEGSLLENETFNTQWFDTVNKTGLWFHTGNVNGKDIWQLPKVEVPSIQNYDTLEDLRSAVDEKFLPYLPTTLMDHDEFRGYWRRNNAEYESVDVSWHKPWVIEGSYARFSYSGDIDVKWPLVAMGLPEITDVTDRESYDFREHPGLKFPDGSQGYEGIYEKLYCPTFRAKDASLDLIKSRIYQVDPGNEIDGYPEATTECRFQLLHDNNVLVNYLFQGMTAEEIWKVVQENVPGGGDTTELSGTYYLESADGGVIGNMAKVAFDGDTATISSDRLNFHTCICSNRMRERVNGRELVRMICDKCDGIFSFEVVDEDTLRFDMDNSSLHGDHHSDWTFEVSDGTVFRHLRDGEDATALPVVFGAPQSQTEEWKQGGATVISW